MSQTLWQAWKASLKGDYLEAGDLYRSAGKIEKALEMYLKAGELKKAALVESGLGLADEAADHLIEAGDSRAAAEVLEEHKQFSRAATLYAELGNFAKAAVMAIEARKPLLAAQYYEKGGMLYEAGAVSHRAGQLGRAMLFFEKALKVIPDMASVDPRQKEEWKRKKNFIARVLEEGNAPERAAVIYEEIGETESAARCRKGAKEPERADGPRLKADSPEPLEQQSADPLENLQEVPSQPEPEHHDVEDSAEILLKTGDIEGAAKQFEELGRERDAATLWRDLGEWERAATIFFRCGEFEEAARCYKEASLFDMAFAAYERAGCGSEACRMAFEAGQWERALDLATDQMDQDYLVKRWQEVPEGSRMRPLARLLLARIFMQTGQAELALECVRDLHGDPLGEGLWADYIHARALESLGMDHEAAVVYRKVVARDVSFEDASERLRGIMSGKGQRHPAQERYTLTEEIDRDDWGIWFRGEDSSLGIPVLLHRLSLKGRGEEDLAGFRVSLRKLIDLRHPNILGLRDIVESGDGIVLVYEFSPGMPLPDEIARRAPASLYEKLELLRRLLQSLQEAHARGLSHGNLSPRSVLVDGTASLKTRGFCLPRHLAPRDGSLEKGKEPDLPEAGVRSDLRAAGDILAGLLAGKFPEKGSGSDPKQDSVRPIPKDTPAGIKNILAQLLTADRARGYSSAEAVLVDLDALELPSGAVIADRYRILEELGRGGMGQVFRVLDTRLDEVVALKTLRGKTGMADASKQRFLMEIKLTRKITHPNVIRIFDMGQFKDLLFLTMEYIPGQTVSDWVRHGAGAKASLGDKVKILTGIASGLEEAHRLGIIHRDLKPQNVILTPDGTPKLLDFGIAFIEESVDLTQDGHFVGSPKYVSPEQIQGKPPDARSDIYCFGLLAHFLLVGEDAFGGDNPTAIIMKQLKESPAPISRFVRIPQSMEKMIDRCLKKRPEERPSSIAEVLGSLKAMV